MTSIEHGQVYDHATEKATLTEAQYKTSDNQSRKGLREA